MQNIRQKILLHAIPHVPRYGWTRNSLVAGCKDIGCASSLNGLVKDMPFDLVDFYQQWLLMKIRSDYLKSFSKTQNDFHANLSDILTIRVSLIKDLVPRWAEVCIHGHL